jgi:hypothetical protein
MLVHVVNAKYVDGYRIEVTFNNGQTGVADFDGALTGPVFEELKDPEKFRLFKIDEELDTIVWENGADMAPEYIYFRAFMNDSSLQQQFTNWGYMTA